MDGESKSIFEECSKKLRLVVNNYSSGIDSLASEWSDDDYADIKYNVAYLSELLEGVEGAGKKLELALENKKELLAKYSTLHLK